jgi:predicted ATPase/DNA-binding XRE family transcriptional regulator
MDRSPPFNIWLRTRREALDLTREALGQHVGCAGATIAKLEAGTRRPSQQLAQRLADALEVPSAERSAFVRLARRGPEARPSSTSTLTQRLLPIAPTPLVGRTDELRRLLRQLQHGAVRLLTISGPPGVGKTRLALEAAHLLAPAFSGGSLFVSLAAVRDPAELPDAIARALELREAADATPTAQLMQAIGEQPLLLLLDTFEQVVAGGALLAELLSACPGLVCLVTSRERLRLRGEHLLKLAPLPLPTADPGDMAAASRSPAVQLFVQVAQAAEPSFTLDPSNVQAVAELCRRLDGLPLAIELLATHCDSVTPAALLGQSDQLLAREGPRDLPERQRTLGATLDWSYGLLEAKERRLLLELSVFVGAWTMSDAEAVCGGVVGASELPVLLASLVGRNLVQPDHGVAEEASFRLLETVRAYGAERLERDGSAAELYARHADYYAALAAQAAPELTGAGQQRWLDRLRHAHTNLEAALAWLLAQGAAEKAGRMCVALRRFWWMAGAFRVGRAWVGRVLARREQLDQLTQAQLQIADGMLASAQGRLGEAIAACETALALAHAEEHAETIGIAAHNLGNLLVERGELERGRRLLEAGLELDRASGDVWGLAVSLGSLGDLCYQQGDYAAAQSYYAESLMIYRRQGDQNSIALTLNNLGEIARRQHNLAAAETALVEGLALVRAIDLRRTLPFLLTNLSLVLQEQGREEQARALLGEALELMYAAGGSHALDTSLFAAAKLAQRGGRAAVAATLLGAAQALRDANGGRLSPGEHTELETLLARVRDGLTPATFTAAWEHGLRQTAAEALELAREQ